MSKLPAQPNQSVIEGIICLQAVITSKNPVGSRELARRLNLNSSRVNRLLKTLAWIGLLKQNQSGKYMPGSGLHALSAQSLFGSGILAKSVKPLDVLRKQVNGIVAMGVLWQDQVCYFYHASCDMDMPSGIGNHGLYPASRSGVGLPLLAMLPAERVKEIYQNKPTPGFDCLDDLLARLKKVKSQDYVWLKQSESNCSIGMALHAETDVAISIAGNYKKENKDELLGYINQARETIIKKL